MVASYLQVLWAMWLWFMPWGLTALVAAGLITWWDHRKAKREEQSR